MEHTAIVCTRKEAEAISLILRELRTAQAKHPRWVNDPIHAAAIMAEEAGETVQAAINMSYAGGSPVAMVREAAQTGAMAVRILANLMAGNYDLITHYADDAMTEAAQAGEAKWARN